VSERSFSTFRFLSTFGYYYFFSEKFRGKSFGYLSAIFAKLTKKKKKKKKNYWWYVVVSEKIGFKFSFSFDSTFSLSFF